MADSTNGNSTYTLAFKVDVDGAKGNLKDYKEYIDNLKGSLLALDKGSEQYEENAKELKAAQEKLNEVMEISKSKGDAVEGSYDNLSQTMSKLKKEWKATGDEARRAELGEQINEINDQLKEMDASVGVFSRNVGNYAGAYEEAFKTVLGELGNMDGKLGDISKDMKGLIPLIKKVNQTALTGLSGIKKAIAATGIGLLVLAVAELVKHFDAVRRTVGITDEKFQEFKTNALEVIHKIVSGVVGVGNSILQFLLTPIRTVIEAFKGLGNVIKDVFTGQWKKIKEDASTAIDGIKNALEKGINFKDSYNKGKEFADTLIANIQAEVNNKGGVTVPVKPDLSPILQRLEEYGLKELDLIKLQTDRKKEALTKRYKEEKELLEKAGLDTTKLTAEYMSNMLKADSEYQDAVIKSQQDADASLLQEMIDNGEDVTSILEGIFDEETMLNMAKNAAIKAQEEQAALEEKKRLEERRKNIQSFVASTTSIIGMVADAWETSIKEQIEAKKIEEKEGEKQFENVKALQTSVAIINTISGIVAALTSPTLQSAGPWGWAAAIAQSVSLAAAGAAQVAKIQSTTLGTTSNQISSVSTPNLGSIINDYQPTYTQNVTNQTELSQLANAMSKQPIYVKVSDVESVTATQNQRVAETTF